MWNLGPILVQKSEGASIGQLTLDSPIGVPARGHFGFAMGQPDRDRPSAPRDKYGQPVPPIALRARETTTRLTHPGSGVSFCLTNRRANETTEQAAVRRAKDAAAKKAKRAATKV